MITRHGQTVGRVPRRRATSVPPRLILHLRRDLPERRQGGRSDSAEVQHQADAVAYQWKSPRTCARAPRRPASRSGGMAYVPQARRPFQPHAHTLPGKCPDSNQVETTWEFLRDNRCPTASSSAKTISSTAAARPGTNSEASHGASRLKDCDIGPTGFDQHNLPRRLLVPRQTNITAGYLIDQS